MRSERTRRGWRAIAAVALALSLTACTGLPTTGIVNVGLPLGQPQDDSDSFPLASRPIAGASPQEIVEGFMEASITPADNWEIARQFLTTEMSRTWQPSAGVTIDKNAADRTLTATVDEAEVESARSIDVQVQLTQVANVDAAGAYTEAPGSSTIPFSLVRDADGEWRIDKAPNGVIVDAAQFAEVYEGYALQYFDTTWSRLVPDQRWFPRRPNAATTVTQALVGGAPSDWLLAAVQTAFPNDVQLAQDAVLVTDQVAEVALTREAAGLDQTTLARMRTQLQATLLAAGVHVTQVRFTVDGRALDAGIVKVAEEPTDAGPIVLTADAFGTVTGDEITPIDGISEDILGIAQPIAGIDVAADEAHAAVQLTDGTVFAVGEGHVDEVDGRTGLVEPSIDPYGYIWTAPASAPSAVQVSSTDATPKGVADAWPEATSISKLRVSSDGARVAAIITVGGQLRLVAAAVIRDDDGRPTALGGMREVTTLTHTPSGLVWLGPDQVGILSDPTSPKVLIQYVGGPGVSDAAPADAVSLAGSPSPAGMRVLDAEGALFARSGSAWHESAMLVDVLATRAGQ